MSTRFWFYVEPYIHLSCKSDDCLLYNTLTGKALIYGQAPDISGLVHRLTSEKNLGVIRISATDLQDQRIATFMEEVRNGYMGDLLDTAWSEAKPIQMVHRPKIQKDADRLKKDADRSIGEGQSAYLREVTFHINAACQEGCPGCWDYYRQFLCCTCDGQGREEMTPGALSGLLEQMKVSRISRINILGGNIFLHSRLQPIVEILKTEACEVAFYLHYTHLGCADAPMDLLDFDGARYYVMVTPPFLPDRFRAARNRIVGREGRTTVVFVVRNDRDMDQATAMSEMCGTAACGIKPYYTGGNTDFFRQSVFMEIDDILGARPAQKEIYANQVLNRLNFGRLTILNSGQVHANVNHPPLGDWENDPLRQILYREMDSGKSWRRTRSGVEPCRDCVFSALCPPLGNYEFALKRNDLCHVKGRGGIA